jgi:uncharacterized protein
MLDQLSPRGSTTGAAPLDPATDPDADLVDFMSVVLDDVQAFWSEVFAGSGEAYQPAHLVIFDDFTESSCGGADARVGPHYCPVDGNVYLDLGFFQELQSRFGATGDLAPAYVLAHEIAHHVQNLVGIAGEVRRLQQEDPASGNELSVRLELQADCLAGNWASTVFVGELETGENLALEPGEIREAMDAAAAVGDDRIQRATTGRIDPETFTHGTSEQRANWFTTGYQTGDPGACDTFTGDV